MLIKLERFYNSELLRNVSDTIFATFANELLP